ncbi:MAG TPA: universal stress protein [Candidatus Limnocylindria bacterium]|nr:universal stress protein [Candidatus Limnocylindria bacterium]
MRVVVAFDGSPSATIAVRLARSLAWPEATTIRVARVLPPPPLGAGARPDVDRRTVDALVSVVDGLRVRGVTPEACILTSAAPADAIVSEARRIGADLIVVGHRGHGAVATVVFGSTARDIAEHASCAVLVARREACGGIVLAEDGSAPAYEARRVLASWPIFRGVPLRVVSVTHVTRPLLAAVGAGARAAGDEREMEARISYRRLASEAAEDLRVAGLAAVAEVRHGDPSAEILAVARERDADLIVMGTRGRGGLDRVLLGSVARSVLLGANASVMVVRA